MSEVTPKYYHVVTTNLGYSEFICITDSMQDAINGYIINTDDSLPFTKEMWFTDTLEISSDEKFAARNMLRCSMTGDRQRGIINHDRQS